MISAEKKAKKKLKQLVDLAERLAAVQYQSGLHPTNPKIKEKVIKSWTEFQIAADDVLNQKFIITQENGVPIGVDSPRQQLKGKG